MDSILTPLQRNVLTTFFQQGAGKLGFFLTGGTALAEFFLKHRRSDDLDLFTFDSESFSFGEKILQKTAGLLNAKLLFDARSANYLRAWISDESESPPLKVGLVQEIPRRIAATWCCGEIVVDSLVDIASNKVGAIYNRAEVKDFVDLYFLLHEKGFALESLLAGADLKQARLDRLNFAYQLEQVNSFKFLPRMVRSITLEDLRSFFLEQAHALYARFRPPK